MFAETQSQNDNEDNTKSNNNTQIYVQIGIIALDWKEQKENIN